MNTTAINTNNGENEMEEDEKMISVYSINDVFSYCPADRLKMLRYKKEYILKVAEQFFSACNCKDKIKEKYYGVGGWTCYETRALALVAIIIQQRNLEISFKKLVHYCKYDQLIKLSKESGDPEGIDILLNVCRNKEEHKKFFSVIKESYAGCNEILPFFGYIKSKQEQQEEDDEKDYYRRRREEGERRELKKQRIKNVFRSVFIATGIAILAASFYFTF